MKIEAARVVFGDDDRAEILRRIDESLRTGSLTLGPHTLELEQQFARDRAADRLDHVRAVARTADGDEQVARTAEILQLLDEDAARTRRK